MGLPRRTSLGPLSAIARSASGDWLPAQELWFHRALTIVGMPEVAVLRVALVDAPLVSAVCDHGMGRQMPPGLLMVGRRRAARPGL